MKRWDASFRRSFLAALFIALAVYFIWLTYHLSMLEIRLGEIEHFLAHQGFFESHCRK